MRRNLIFDGLAEALQECRDLLDSGYHRHGNWSLGQICRHIRLTMEANMDGYPRWMTILGFPLRPFIRRFGLPGLLAGKSPKGLPTAGMFMPPKDTEDDDEVEALARCIETFLSGQGKLHAHPGFGSMSREQFEHFHAAHLGHHLGFLSAEQADA